MKNEIWNGNSEELLKKIPNNSIDMVITSPPYDELRSNKDYVSVFNFELIAKELGRVLKEGGVIAWVVGDQSIDNSESGTSFRQALYFKDVVGLKLYDTMIYSKSGFSFPSNGRYHQTFEYIFVFSKGNPNTFNPLMDRPILYKGGHGPGGRNKDGSKKTGAKSRRNDNDFGKRFNIWHYRVGGGQSSTDKIAYKHPAIFPEKLAEDLLLSWTNEGDLVLDPFAGSGTTLKMAKKNNRNYLGLEISNEYCKIIEERLK